MGFLNYPVICLLLIAAFIFACVTSVKVKTTFRKYSKVLSSRNQPAYDIVRQVLDAEGMYDVSVGFVSGELTDHYDPRSNNIALSSAVYNSTSVGAYGVALHEAGHAMQYAKGYFPMKIRAAILPVANLGSQVWSLLFILGLIFSWGFLVDFGVILFAFIVLFQFITHPIEINASRRAITTLRNTGILTADELKGAKAVLTAAAMTYVASLAIGVLQLLRLLSIRSRQD